jgi:polyphenol oxidase
MDDPARPVSLALIRPNTFEASEHVFAAFTTRHFAGPSREAAHREAAGLAASEGFIGVAFTEQVHEARVARVDRPCTVAGHDGLVTRQPGLLLGTVAADCALILLADVRNGVVGACHAGWRGAVAGIVGETLSRMADLGAEPAHTRAFIGPCISLEAFEVGEEVASRFEPRHVHRRDEWPRPHVDLRGAVAHQLRQGGVPEDLIEVSGDCTLLQPETYYSYRGEGGTAGRLLGLIGLRKSDAR